MSYLFVCFLEKEQKKKWVQRRKRAEKLQRRQSGHVNKLKATATDRVEEPVGQETRNKKRYKRRKEQRKEARHELHQKAREQLEEMSYQNKKQLLHAGQVAAARTVSSSRGRAKFGKAADVTVDPGKNAVRKLKRELQKEANRAKKVEGFANITFTKEVVKKAFDGKKYERDAYFFHGSKNHLPDIPKIDAGKKGRKRRVIRKIVEEEFEILDCPGGVHSEFFTLVPGGLTKITEAEEQKLFESLDFASKQTRSIGDCRWEKDGERMTICDGEDSRYMNFGTNKGRYGGGLHTTSMQRFNDQKPGKETKMDKESNEKPVETEKEKAEREEAELQRSNTFAVFSGWIRRLEDCAKGYLPVPAQRLARLIRESEEFAVNMIPLQGGRSEIYSGIVAGKNVFLNGHRDTDAMDSITGVVSNCGREHIVCYFCFPTVRKALALRSGDILMFNPQIPHCVSSRCDPNKDSYCISMYTHYLVPTGYSLDQAKLTQEEEQYQKEMLQISRSVKKERNALLKKK